MIRLRPHHLLCTQGYSGKAKSAAEAAEAKCRALEAELAALRDRQAQNNGKHPNHNRK